MSLLTTKDWIQVLISASAVIVSIVAVIISILSLKANQKSVENANKPYVVAYLAWMWIDNNLKEYLAIKNFKRPSITGYTAKNVTPFMEQFGIPNYLEADVVTRFSQCILMNS